jgi:hypothetical protein
MTTKLRKQIPNKNSNSTKLTPFITNKPFKKLSLKWNSFLGFGGKKEYFVFLSTLLLLGKNLLNFSQIFFFSLKKNQNGNNV